MVSQSPLMMETKLQNGIVISLKERKPQVRKRGFAIDLGEQTNLIDGLKVSYFNKVYPINYEVQVSNDNKTWTTVKTLTREHDGEAHPKDDIQF